MVDLLVGRLVGLLVGLAEELLHSQEALFSKQLVISMQNDESQQGPFTVYKLFVYQTFTAKSSGNYKVAYKIHRIEEVDVLLKEGMGTYISNVIVRFQLFYECCVRSFRNKVDAPPFAQFCRNPAK